MDEKTIKEAKLVLEEISKEGLNFTKEIESNLKSSLTSGSIEEKLVEPNYFFYFLFESLWKLFKTLSGNIENPLIQPWIRIVIEQSSDIIYYSNQSDEDKKAIACKYFLCTLGFLDGKQGNLTYDHFLTSLNELEKKDFLKIKEEGYPKRKIHQIWHEIFPPINEGKIPDLIEKYFLTIKENSIKKIQLEMLFRDMSLYHHPNLIINNLDREFKDKSHIFRCFALLSICGMSLLRFSTEYSKDKVKQEVITNLNKQVNELIVKLHQK